MYYGAHRVGPPSRSESWVVVQLLPKSGWKLGGEWGSHDPPFWLLPLPLVEAPTSRGNWFTKASCFFFNVLSSPKTEFQNYLRRELREGTSQVVGWGQS